MRINGLKICGISDPETARFCAEQGVGAVGMVFFEKSPRNVSADKARRISAALPEDVARVGVFVDMPLDELLQTAGKAALTTVQLHGNESNAEIMSLQAAGYRVIKVLKRRGAELLKDASDLPTGTGIMVESSHGKLPGGNGTQWNWSEASILSGICEFALAGGLTADNLAQAQRFSGAAAFDLSSAVESRPGIKEPVRIKQLCRRAAELNINRIFWR
jgi:phosphoribosylanthranilate isomerase